jgi:integral membrane sensor domain MASE1
MVVCLQGVWKDSRHWLRWFGAASLLSQYYISALALLLFNAKPWPLLFCGLPLLVVAPVVFSVKDVTLGAFVLGQSIGAFKVGQDLHPPPDMQVAQVAVDPACDVGHGGDKICLRWG